FQFAFKSPLLRRMRPARAEQDLDRHLAMRGELDRLVDDALTAAADLRQNAVAGDLRHGAPRSREPRRPAARATRRWNHLPQKWVILAYVRHDLPTPRAIFQMPAQTVIGPAAGKRLERSFGWTHTGVLQCHAVA